jgi:histidinol-phosphate aminotransferase
MVDVKRSGREFQQNMLNEKIAIGRTWKALPTFVRVTVGTADEMAKFQAAFVKCMDMPVTSPTVANSETSSLYIPTEMDHA